MNMVYLKNLGDFRFSHSVLPKFKDDPIPSPLEL